MRRNTEDGASALLCSKSYFFREQQAFLNEKAVYIPLLVDQIPCKLFADIEKFCEYCIKVVHMDISY